MMLTLGTSFIIGAVFGFGLSLSQMVDPARVLGFLDVAGRWDPTLLFVMGGALAVTLPAFRWIVGRGEPLLEKKFFLPTKHQLDPPLIWGAAIFGVGWGLGGFCPGPALANLAVGSPTVILFVLAMIVGQRLAISLEI
jgi:uncharacterized membrane protein YedE/YeeE